MPATIEGWEETRIRRSRRAAFDSLKDKSRGEERDTGLQVEWDQKTEVTKGQPAGAGLLHCTRQQVQVAEVTYKI